MTKEVHDFVARLGLTGKCLDVGSYDVNGSVKDLYEDYTGLDVREGPNVNIVWDMCHPDGWIKLGQYDVVTCLEMLEHCKNPFLAVHRMMQVVKVGGVLVLTTPNIGFPRHDYPSDYWRFTLDGLKVLIEGMEIVAELEDRDHAYIAGRKV